MLEQDYTLILKELWNHDHFLPLQEEIILSVLNGYDTLALLPTGGGKSICYQIPALMEKGITLVISPLMALIKDQIQQLQAKSINSLYLSAEQGYLDQIEIFDYIRNGNCKILYVSPERLSHPVFRQAIKSLPISLIAVDEAHCVSEWGNDFRSSYLKIKEFRQELEYPKMIALTATATPEVQKDIVEKLGLQEPLVFKKSFKRKNLSIQVLESENKIAQIEHYLKKHPVSAIIYARTRKEVENISQVLHSKGFSVDYFHAGLTVSEKNNRQNLWMQNQIKILVATNAFGMGIDKKDVGLIIHSNLPYSIENYYQEIGRAGRDGKEAFTYLLYNEYDIKQLLSEWNQNSLTEKEFKQFIKLFYSKLQIAQYEFYENTLTFDIQEFIQAFGFTQNKIFSILQFLENNGILYWRHNSKTSKIQILLSPYEVENLQGIEASLLELLSRNISGIYNQLCKFDEYSTKEALGLSSKELKTYLQKWKELGWIDYEDGESHQIQFLEPRNDKYIFNQLYPIYKRQRDHKKIKIQNLVYYLRQEEQCRMKLLLKYFGETAKDNCGQCDICNKNKPSEHKGLEHKIYALISQKDTTLQEILAEFYMQSPNEIVDALQYLISEEKIRNKNFNTYTLNQNNLKWD